MSLSIVKPTDSTHYYVQIKTYGLHKNPVTGVLEDTTGQHMIVLHYPFEVTTLLEIMAIKDIPGEGYTVWENDDPCDHVNTWTNCNHPDLDFVLAWRAEANC
jgi:hypothetical protein